MMEKQFDIFDDLLIEFDEVGFLPTNFPHDNDEHYAIDWKKRLINALAGYRKQNEWISVEDRLPESGASVLGYSEIVGDIRCYDICKGRCDDTLQWWSETGWATVDDLLVTHWMPLPEPPEMKGGES